MSFLTARADAAYRRQFLAVPEVPTNFGSLERHDYVHPVFAGILNSLTPEQRKDRDAERADWLREESRQERAAERWAE